ncbi:MAG: hypothetical protein UT65_C0018G0001, partial [Parcubacteria group bacterium GW2011_GWF2_39_8b]
MNKTNKTSRTANQCSERNVVRISQSIRAACFVPSSIALRSSSTTCFGKSAPSGVEVAVIYFTSSTTCFRYLIFLDLDDTLIDFWILKEIDFKTHRGKHLVLANIYLILRNSFYTGQFEFPVGSGQWYIGKHTPIIDKELFDKVQNALNENYIPKTESKEFAFTKLIKCGYCSAGITADEKFRKLVGGG